MTDRKHLHTLTIVRQAQVLAWAVNGDPTLIWFRDALKQWLTNLARGECACFVCNKPITNEASWRCAFLFVQVSVQQSGPPSEVVLAAACGECAARSDNELRQAGLAWLRTGFSSLTVAGIISNESGSSH
jgi:hypothetical protein